MQHKNKTRITRMTLIITVKNITQTRGGNLRNKSILPCKLRHNILNPLIGEIKVGAKPEEQTLNYVISVLFINQLVLLWA